MIPQLDVQKKSARAWDKDKPRTAMSHVSRYNFQHNVPENHSNNLFKQT
jgi:hypothetical protein